MAQSSPLLVEKAAAGLVEKAVAEFTWLEKAMPASLPASSSSSGLHRRRAPSPARPPSLHARRSDERRPPPSPPSSAHFPPRRAPPASLPASSASSLPCTASLPPCAQIRRAPPASLPAKLRPLPSPASSTRLPPRLAGELLPRQRGEPQRAPGLHRPRGPPARRASPRASQQRPRLSRRVAVPGPMDGHRVGGPSPSLVPGEEHAARGVRVVGAVYDEGGGGPPLALTSLPRKTLRLGEIRHK
ncbi:uncharacterized protein [Miscanthus floridulus]|uniref:uncharacterized protein n=1 Tax=Miscanthus floridulus TaxID=154761 RepID=UPI00345AD7A8